MSAARLATSNTLALISRHWRLNTGLDNNGDDEASEIVELQDASNDSDAEPETSSEILGAHAPHLNEIHQALVKNGLKDVLLDLPPPEDYDFVNIGQSRLTGYHVLKEKLFIGEDGDYQYRAYLQDFELKADEVVITREGLQDDTFTKMKSLGQITSLMYPFQTFKDHANGDSRTLLCVFIRYLFRDAGRLDRPFTRTAMTDLERALKSIERRYADFGGAQSTTHVLTDRSRVVQASVPESVTRGPDSVVARNNQEISGSLSETPVARLPPSDRAIAELDIEETMSRVSLLPPLHYKPSIRGSKRKSRDEKKWHTLDGLETQAERERKMKEKREREMEVARRNLIELRAQQQEALRILQKSEKDVEELNKRQKQIDEQKENFLDNISGRDYAEYLRWKQEGGGKRTG
ncbi:hypothetical protein K491DRAFT_722939 [Lophiostoma macrostomum CBS 122681]|uniref:Uncharacterized protein n=1 Tax=Lophiostoma macrostomum CBS 122681 TaxID=1314788 RepID=A0A6A6SM24_9PLEO|nr:hypothetical protein K491DRAFT_722939 [Lophiostoma macrostomum CBS 122681]